MLNHGHFYHASVKNSIIVFGKLFSDIYIKRDNADGSANQFVKVPITYGPKEKWLYRTEDNPDLTRGVEIVLPRMSFEITGFQYDTARKLHSINQLIVQDPIDATKRRVQFVPVPYNLSVELNILTKTQEDALQIVEQILPFFTPQYNVTVNLDPEMGYSYDLPTVLNSVDLTDNYEGPMEEKRTVIYTLQFTMKTQMFGPIEQSQDVINIVNTNINNAASQTLETMAAISTATTPSTQPISSNPITTTSTITGG